MSFIRSVFGENWKKRFSVFVIVYLLLLLWPLILFHRSIEFKPAAFTQEWLRTIAGVSVIFLILEYQKYLFDQNKKKAALSDVLKRKLLAPLEDFMSKIQTGHNTPHIQTDDIVLKWTELSVKLEELEFEHSTVALQDHKLYNFRKEFRLDELDSFIKKVIQKDAKFDMEKIRSTIAPLIESAKLEIKLLK